MSSVSQKVRNGFIDFFQKNGHQPVPSSSLLPDNDPTLLFTNAGMNQFKNVFLGHEKRPYQRAVTVQKCVRAGGKHNDLENVGHTARHHTFFEMMGNFSFGDYFKSEAIRLAWELLTKDFGIPKEKLYVSVFETDDEAAQLWHKQENVPKDRIFRFGEKDNFWRMGETGPCGPCSEIYYDHGKEHTGIDLPPLHPDAGDRYVEIWNLVFMQFNEDGTGQKPLPKPSVDTGSGLERVTAVLQGRVNNYETDVFTPLIDVISKLAKQNYEYDWRKRAQHPEVEAHCASMRVLADHIRACSFMLADGIVPSNDGRGYVLRRILRRAVRYGRTLTEDTSFLVPLADTLIAEMSGFYPELKAKAALIKTTLQDEETRFLKTLDQGLFILQEELKKLGSSRHVPGTVAFRLYDTFGFPLDLTQLIARESQFSVDVEGFDREMEQSRVRAKASWQGKLNSDHGVQIQVAQKVGQPTEFVGYTSLRATSPILALMNTSREATALQPGDTGAIITQSTPFYAEGGGQVGDSGTIAAGDGHFEVAHTIRVHDVIFHLGRVSSGHIKTGEHALLEVTHSERRSTANNHSATHLLHAALRKVLGAHVGQAGSSVTSERLRFDFTHNKPVTEAELLEVETLVNQEIDRAEPVAVEVLPYKEALDRGAIAMFGEKYGDQVRVVRMGEFSTELCGGTHVSNTSQIRAFTVTSQSAVSAGVRRIEALTGRAAIEFLTKNAEENLRVRSALGLTEAHAPHANNSPNTGILEWIDQTKNEIRDLERQIKTLKAQKIDVDGLWQAGQKFGPNNQILITFAADLDDRDVLSGLVDQLKTKTNFGAAVVIGKSEGTSGHPVLVAVAESLSKSKPAAQLLKEVTAVTGGRGGGRPTFAQGAAENLDHLPEAFARALSFLQNY